MAKTRNRNLKKYRKRTFKRKSKSRLGGSKRQSRRVSRRNKRNRTVRFRRRGRRGRRGAGKWFGSSNKSPPPPSQPVMWNMFNGRNTLSDVTVNIDADGHANLPTGTTIVTPFAFHDCRQLQTITLPAGLTNIGESAFQSCRNLQTIILPAGLTNIGDYAFQNCRSLVSVGLPSSLIYIGDYAFQNCVRLREVDLPWSVRGAKLHSDTVFPGGEPQGLNVFDETDTKVTVVNQLPEDVSEAASE